MREQNWCDRCEEIVSKDDDLWTTGDVYGVFDSRGYRDTFDDGSTLVCQDCLAGKEFIEEGLLTGQ